MVKLDSCENEVWVKELWALVFDVLGEDNFALMWGYHHGWSCEELGGLFGLKVSTVKMRLMVGKRKLSRMAVHMGIG